MRKHPRNPTEPHLIGKHTYGVIIRRISDDIRDHHLKLYSRIEYLEGENDRLREQTERAFMSELQDTIEFAERRLQVFCGMVNAGQAQGGGREFSRQIDAQFRQIREEAGIPAFDSKWNDE